MKTEVIYRTSLAPTTGATRAAVESAWRAMQDDSLWPPSGWQSFISALGGVFGMPPVQTRPTEPRTITVIWVSKISLGLGGGQAQITGLTEGTRDDPRILVVGSVNGSSRVSSTALSHEIGHVACWRARGSPDPYHGKWGGPYTETIAKRLTDVDAALRAQGL